MARTHGVTVEMLDLEKLAEIFRNVDNEADRETRKGFTADAFMSTGIIRNPEGFIRTINDEGVADSGVEGDTFTNTFAVYTWYGYITFSQETILECVTDEIVDLADLIRVFGDRLERNFSINYRWSIGNVKGR